MKNLKQKLFRLLLRLKLFKYYYTGKEYLKNPPIVEVPTGKCLDGIKIINSKVVCRDGTSMSNCSVISTFKF